jgi:hypothetical protein
MEFSRRGAKGRVSADLVPRALIVERSGVGYLSALDRPESGAEELADFSGRRS